MNFLRNLSFTFYVKKNIKNLLRTLQNNGFRIVAIAWTRSPLFRYFLIDYVVPNVLRFLESKEVSYAFCFFLQIKNYTKFLKNLVLFSVLSILPYSRHPGALQRRKRLNYFNCDHTLFFLSPTVKFFTNNRIKNEDYTTKTKKRFRDAPLNLKGFKQYKKNFAISVAWTLSSLFWIKARTSYYTNNWIYTTNHKRIAVNYFWFVILSGIVGMVLATIIRLEFAYPGVGILAGDSIQYLSLASAHGVIMVFFMIMPLLFGAFANFLLPTQLGVHDVAFPRLNSAAFWFLPGGLLMLCQLVCVDRRYQRMNCFNIREAESLLKRKFFTDLINSKDHHVFLNKTALGLRYKISNSSFFSNNMDLAYVYGLIFTSQFRNGSYLDFNSVNLNSSKIFNNTVTFSLDSYSFKIISYFNFTNFFFLLNFFSSLSLKKSFLLLNVSNFTYDFSFFTLILKNICDFFRVNVLTTINGCFKSFLKIFSFERNPLPHFLLPFHGLNLNFMEIFYIPYGYYFKHFIKSFNLVIGNFPQVPFLHLFTLNSDWFFFLIDNNKYIYKKTFIFILDVFFRSLQFLIRAAQFDLIRTKFTINYNFNDNYFFVNVLTLFKISINNWIVAFSWKNNTYRLKSLLGKESAHSSFEKKGLGSVWYKNIWDDVLVGNYWNSLSLEIYSLIYLILNLPLALATLILYLFTEHFQGVDLHKLTKDSIFLHYNILNGTDVWKKNFTVVELNNIKEVHRNILKEFPFFFERYLNLFMDLTDFFYSFFVYLDQNILKLYSLKDNFFFELRSSYGYLLSNTSIYVLKFKLDLWQSASALQLFLIKGFNVKISKKFYNKQTNAVNNINTDIFSSTNSKETFLFNNEELSNNSRFRRFELSIFKYDYKSGDYFPKLYKDAYTFLIPSFLDLTGGLRTPAWFFSINLTELLELSMLTTLSDLNKKFNFSDVEIASTKYNKLSHSDAFYGFFFTLNNVSSDLNFKWISTNSLNTKFNRMFLTSSLQQRIYNNWRTLKFTREAWRCKMLSARHQKTLFRRYMHEDGVFWSIERNAKDLIPGWAMITPFSSRTRYTAVGKTDIGLMGVLLVLNSSIISGANFLVTYRYLSTLNNRKMRDARAFFTEAVMVASWMMILANPMLVIGIIMLLSDRHWQTSFFDYSGGGDTVLFQHMFWFFGHPEVYVIIIPTFGFTNTMISYYLKKRVSARASLLYSLYTIAFLGFFVWGHHMYMVGLSHTTRMLFSTLTVMISVPAATKIMHWCVTTANSAFSMELPLLFTFTFIFFFVSGGISGMCVAHTGMDVLFHDTFYVIGHFHVMLAGGAMFASFGAFYFYFPAIFGVKYSRVYAYLHYVYYLIGQLMTVVPMFWLGYAGMPRRVLDYPAAFGGWHSVISAGHMLNVAGLMAFFIMIFDSLRQAKAATRNTFGISRYNSRLNFYLYETARLSYVQQKTLFLFRSLKFYNLKLNGLNFLNFEPYESVLFSYVLTKNKV